MTNMMGATMRRRFLVPLVIVCLAVLPKLAEADPIVGVLHLSGSSVLVNATTIDWGADGPPDGEIEVQATSTGYFSATGPYGSLAGFIDVLLDLDQATYPAGPAGTFAPLVGFETIIGTGLNFTLVNIDECDPGNPNPTANCPFGGTTPFHFSEFGGSTTINLSMHGTVVDPVMSPGEISTWQGTFSADFPGMTIDQVVAQFSSAGFIIAPFSAAKVTVEQVVPEPLALTLLGVGMVGLGVRARRRRVNASA